MTKKEKILKLLAENRKEIKRLEKKSQYLSESLKRTAKKSLNEDFRSYPPPYDPAKDEADDWLDRLIEWGKRQGYPKVKVREALDHALNENATDFDPYDYEELDLALQNDPQLAADIEAVFEATLDFDPNSDLEF